jgi:hypothetical protein
VEALARDASDVGSVRQILDRNRNDRGLPPAVVPRFVTNAKAGAVVVRPHALSQYDALQSEADDEPF